MLIYAMLPPLLSFIAVGCLAFFLCVAVPALRRWALAALVWFLSLGVLFPSAFFPNMVAVARLTEKHFHAHAPLNAAAVHHMKEVALVNCFIVMFIATMVAVLHGFFLRRMPFVVFRMYVSAAALLAAAAAGWSVCVIAAVTGGNSLLGVSLGLLLLTLSVVSLYVYRHAQFFRAQRPARLQPAPLAEYQHPGKP